MSECEVAAVGGDVVGAACRSGIILAAVHADDLAGWIVDGGLPAEMKPFSASRFGVQTAH